MRPLHRVHHEVHASLEARRIEPVALQPALDLLADLAELGGDLTDIPSVLLEQGDQLVVTGIALADWRRFEPRGRDLLGQVLREQLATAGEGGGAFECTPPLADVARPAVRA